MKDKHKIKAYVCMGGRGKKGKRILKNKKMI